MIDLDLSGLIQAEAELSREGVTLMRDSASVCQETAQRNARVDTGDMRRQIVLVPTGDGADVEARSPISVFHEYGTGKFNERGGRQTPWVYTPDGGVTFFTTEGVTSQPMMRPGFAAGRDYFEAEKKRRGL